MSERYEHLLSTIPAQLEAAVMFVLSNHNGREKAISRDGLVEECRRYGCKADERQVREAVKNLRRKKNLIGAAAGEDGGYYICSSLAEVDDFIAREYGAKIADMAETRDAMLTAAREQFGDAEQLVLF